MDYKLYNLTYAESVFQTLNGIYSYIQREFHSEQAATNKVKRLLDGMERLKLFPEAGFDVAQKIGKILNKDYQTRGFVVEDYLVFYYIAEPESTVYVTHLVSSKTDYMDLFEEQE